MRPIPDQDQLQPRIEKVADDGDVLNAQDTIHAILNNKLLSFDHVFGPSTPQNEIYATLGKDLVSKFIEGNNVTVLAFGQASSGKSFTLGTARQTSDFDEHADGVIPRAMAELFEVLQQQSLNNTPLFTTSASTSTVTPSSSKRNSAPHRLSNISTAVAPRLLKGTNTIRVSFLEVYNEKLVDLLNEAPITDQPPITIHEDINGRIYWKGANQVNVNSVKDVLSCLKKGAKSHTTASATCVNEKSSHSHTIFSVTLCAPVSCSATSQHQPQRLSYPRWKQSHNDQLHHGGGEWVVKTSRLHFVDFAGDVYSSLTDNEGNQLKAGTSIDQGLQAFGNVLSALGDISTSGTRIPYQDSMLTRLLQDSIGGGAITVAIACASPLEQDLSETLNTLRYISYTRNIKNTSSENGVRTRKTSNNLDIITKPSGTLSSSTEAIPNLPLRHPFTAYDGPSTDNNGTIEHPKEHQTAQYQQSIITGLQQQIKELNRQVNASEEHNKSVENELQHFKNLHQQSMFVYLAEPVVEVYEECVSKLEAENSVLEAENSVLKAAANYSNTAMDELQLKCNSLQQTVNRQQDTMIEQHHKIGTYLDELKTKLKYLQGPQNGASKRQQIAWKIDYHTRNMEQVLGDQQKQTRPTMYNTDSTSTGTQTTIEQQHHTKLADWSQQQSTLHELVKLKEKYKQLEEDRNKWKTQAELYPGHLDQLIETTTHSKTGSLQHRNYHTSDHSRKAEQSRTATTATTTTRIDNNKQSDTTSRMTLNTSTANSPSSYVSISKFQTGQLGGKYTQAINELDGVLQHYFEMMEHTEHLEHISIMETTQPSTITNSVSNNVSLLLSLACSTDTLDSGTETATETTTSMVDDCISELASFSSSSTDF